MICTDDASSSSSSASSTFRRGFLGFWSSIHANTTLNCMFWSSSRKILKMMSPIQEKIAKKIVKKRFKKDCKKDIFFLEKSCENIIFLYVLLPVKLHNPFRNLSNFDQSVTHRQTDTHTHRQTHIIKFEGPLHKRPFGQKNLKNTDSLLPIGLFRQG